MFSKLISTFLTAGFFGSSDVRGPIDGASVDERAARGGSSLKSSLNWSSRKRTGRGMRSTRATWPLSVRCPVWNKRNVPSELHETELLNTLDRKLTCLLGP